MTTCKHENCDAPAVGKAYWPSAPPIPYCAAHLTGALKIAAAMGFYLHTEALEDASANAPSKE
jgi:hypothetical protein